ncbi:hypothetical protein [uncultured Roseobacter sp.]|uniref:hypothetical protein n=1 Tax=uncultured Roseobacter sp. TaxID=114847 RepID=UPI00262AC03D|nr:hypothetical protein [uncultured Roseobacter sp.]
MIFDPMFLTVACFVWFASALIGGAIASGRERDGAVWFVVCLILGPLPIIGLLLFGNDAQRS